jgi:hypothetical protein
MRTERRQGWTRSFQVDVMAGVRAVEEALPALSAAMEFAPTWYRRGRCIFPAGLWINSTHIAADGGQVAAVD